MTGLTEGAARTRAVAAAQALLHQPGATGAAEAWHVMGVLDRLAAELRTACLEAETGGALDEVWPAPAAALVIRLEEATTWWTGRSSFPWATWDEAATAELGMLLCELDALAAALLTAAAEAAGSAHSAESAASPEPAGLIESVEFPFDEFPFDRFPFDDEPAFLHAPRLPLLRRRPPVRLLPSLSLAAAVIGVIGGVTATATHTATAAVPRRAIAGEPVPFTLQDGEQARAAAPEALPSGAASSAAGNGNRPGTPHPLSAQQQAADAAARQGTSTGGLPPRHAAPRQHGRHTPPLGPSGPAQSQIDDLFADIRNSAEQQAARRLHPVNWPPQEVRPAGLTPWG